MPQDVPNCPRCESPMQKRTARRGRNAGGQFWGCSKFPRCRGTRDVSDTETRPASGNSGEKSPKNIVARQRGTFRPRVEWTDSARSTSWTRLYTSGGGRLRSTDLFSSLDSSDREPMVRRLQQTFLAVSEDAYQAARSELAVQRVAGTLRKILQRGDAPPLDPDSEKKLLELVGVRELLPSIDPGDISFEIGPGSSLPSPSQLRAAACWSDDRLDIEPSIEFDSREEKLLVELVHEKVGPGVARWLVPQAPLDTLVSAQGIPSTGSRRVDFLFSPPWGSPLVIEIDGKDHESQVQVDEDRDRLLRQVSIPVERIPASEVREGRGENLARVLETLSCDFGPQPDAEVLQLVYGPLVGTQLGLALAEAIERGWLSDKEQWQIEIRDSLSLAPLFLPSLL